jgi:CxxC motif-containing protein
MKEMICIICPRGCRLKVADDGTISGNQCLRGIRYAQDEMSHPMRNLTSTVRLKSAKLRRLPVSTSQDIPKDKMFEVMRFLDDIEVQAPVQLRQVIVANILNLGVDIIATRSVNE